MKGVLLSIFLVGLIQCSKDGNEIGCDNACGTIAKVVDASALDGCGIMFELEDGTRLDPERRTYIQAPTKEGDPLYHFDLKVG